ncbi:hypothetical protein L9F63_022145 [Diploptera punctata]|uniref:WKF domain-containing protein n=1 Tax=Diploptera punctata TaxID=6984 RepID=A0AAD8EBC5_DIPPU|nr:hypothetical protein L9F63_022145 [Diploptera punctata]
MKREKSTERGEWLVDDVPSTVKSNSKHNSKETTEPDTIRQRKKKKVHIEDTTEEINKSNDTKNENPKKRKKKKKPKKGKIQAVCKDENKNRSIDYLKTWDTNRHNWKFEKLRQIWLFKNMFNIHNVPDSVFPILLEYISGTKGHARKMVVKNAMNVVKAMESWQELVKEGLSEEEIATKLSTDKVDEETYERARLIIQSLDDE